MAMSAERWSKFAALHWLCWRLHMSEKFSSGTINKPKTNKTNQQSDESVENSAHPSFLIQ